jgi:predicted HicB family RNase H-like nuclease
METHPSDDKQMSKKLIANIPDRTHALLKVWADKDGLSLSALSAHLLKIATDEAEREGRIALEDDD